MRTTTSPHQLSQVESDVKVTKRMLQKHQVWGSPIPCLASHQECPVV